MSINIEGRGPVDESQLEINCSDPQELCRVEQVIAEHGVAVLRNAYSPAPLTGLFDNLRTSRDEALRTLDGETSVFDESYDFNPAGMSFLLSAADPYTRRLPARDSNGVIDRTPQTSLYEAMQNGPGWNGLTSLLGEELYFKGCWIRVIASDAGTPGDRKGALFFHQEKWGIRNEGVPLGYNAWVLLNPDNEVANRETAGIQFALGDRAFWTSTELGDAYEDVPRKRITQLNRASRGLAAPGQETDFHFFRPEVRVGDIVVFDHHVPHASYVPKTASDVRVSCDLRLFPGPRKKVA